MWQRKCSKRFKLWAKGAYTEARVYGNVTNSAAFKRELARLLPRVYIPRTPNPLVHHHPQPSCSFPPLPPGRFFQSSNLLNLFSKRRCVSKLLIAAYIPKRNSCPGIAVARRLLYTLLHLSRFALYPDERENSPTNLYLSRFVPCNALCIHFPRYIYINMDRKLANPAKASVSFVRSFVQLGSSRFVSFRLVSRHVTLYMLTRPCISQLLQSLHIHATSVSIQIYTPLNTHKYMNILCCILQNCNML